MKNNLKNILIYESIWEFLPQLSNEQVGILFKGINEWRLGNEVIFDDLLLKGLWIGILPNLDKLKDNYNNIVERNKNNGKKGGRPKTQDNPNNRVGFLETQDNPKNLKERDKDKEKDKEKDKNKEIENSEIEFDYSLKGENWGIGEFVKGLFEEYE